MITLHDYHDSGNGYKVRLLLELIGKPYRTVERDILTGETRTKEFLAINPIGRVPVIEVDAAEGDSGGFLAESNAILYYLAQDSAYFPLDRWLAAQVMQWLFFEQYCHEPNVAVARFIVRHEPDDSPRRDVELTRCIERGQAALDVMEAHLRERREGERWMVGDRCTIADIALYAYTHVAEQGGFEMQRYPTIKRWISAVQNQPGYQPM